MWKAALVVVLAGCGPATVADACFELADVVCSKASSCGTIVGTLERCRSENTAACCAGVDTCSRAPKPGSVERLRQCEAAVRAMTCGQVAGNLVPAACATQ